MVKLMPSSEDVRVYEVAVMYAPDLTQGSENELLKEIEAGFTDAGGKLLFKDPWTKRGLAYKIGGFEEAKYVMYYYEIDPSKMREIDANIRLMKGVLRHLIVIPPKGYEAVSYEERYQHWMTNRETVKEMRSREKEEKLKQNVVDKAKRETRRTAEKAKTAGKTPAMDKGKISESLDKLISDEDLKI